MAYHGAAADGPAPDNTQDKSARRLLRRAVAARQRLADTEEALGRVTAGTFGRCEQCADPIAQPLLAAVPETRYCGVCAGSVFGELVTRAGATLVPAARR
jgi:RNA polymerase-binding transcription factor DksA